MSSRWKPGQTGNPKGRVAADFWSGVDSSGGEDNCWPWTRCCRPQGYGAYRGTGAHRYAYTDTKGPIPEGLVVRHECDNPPCCNPKHLVLGTQSQNAMDAVSRGRMKNSIGAACLTAALAKLPTEEIEAVIRELETIVRNRQPLP